MMNNKLVAGIKVNGKVMREFKEDIYIPFGTDYSIFLKNLNSVKAQVKISIDDRDILDGKALLIDPNENLDLERWLVGGNNTGPKLKFVEKTEKIRETKTETGMDGIVVIKFQFEQVYSPNHILYHENYYPPVTYGTSDDRCRGLDTFSTSCDVQCSSSDNTDGFTVKGEESNQSFKNGYIGTLEEQEHTICFKLKGGHQKPITVKTRFICDACQSKMPLNYKFCSHCGNNLQF